MGVVIGKGRRKLLAGLLLTGLAPMGACGGAGGGGEPEAPLMEQTAAGKSRCTNELDGDARLFVVEWDATDLSSFEAAAESDVVFVRYEDCQLRVLHGCKDGALQGRYGRYGQVQATSGAVEAIAIRDQSELSAKLPLGAATLGGSVSSDQGLELRYFVAGVKRATRDDVYQQEIAQNDRCASATHFIYAYDLGAFELHSVSQQELGASATVAGMGAEGKRRTEQSRLKNGGKLPSCETHAQTQCRAPIRLTARPIRPGARPAAASAALPATAAASAGQAAAAKAMGQMNAMQLRLSAEQKEAMGDGGGCLQDLERADATDPIGAKTHRFLMLRAWCTMRAGRCDEGKKMARQALAANDKKAQTPRMSDAQLDHLVKQHADAKCSTAKAGGVSAQQRVIAGLQTFQMARASGDGPQCVKAGDDIATGLQALSGPPQGAMKAAVMALLGTAQCAAKAKLCSDAKRLHGIYYKLENPGKSDGERQKSFDFMISECTK